MRVVLILRSEALLKESSPSRKQSEPIFILLEAAKDSSLHTMQAMPNGKAKSFNYLQRNNHLDHHFNNCHQVLL